MPSLEKILEKVPFDGPWAEEQPLADLDIGKTVTGKPGNHGLLGGQAGWRTIGARADGRAGSEQLEAGSVGETVEPHCGGISEFHLGLDPGCPRDSGRRPDPPHSRARPTFRSRPRRG